MTQNDRIFVIALFSATIGVQSDSLIESIASCLVFVVTAFLMSILFRDGKPK
jgi:hypothetical protein